MRLVEEDEVEGRQAGENKQRREESQVGDETAAVLGRLLGGVQERADDVAGRLADEDEGRRALLFGVAGCILGRPGVDQGSCGGQLRSKGYKMDNIRIPG